jgi:hypothetical protein
MDRALMIWVEGKSILRRLRAQRAEARQLYTDSTIALVWLWAVLNNQTAKWACRPLNWPGKLPPGGLPSPSRFSRRVSTPRFKQLLAKLERHIAALDPPSTGHVVTLIGDGHALPVARHSRDRHARCGRGAGGMARGYKLHPLIDDQGRILGWRLAPMNQDEGEMLRRLLRDTGATLRGYLLADASYDDNWLFAAARERGVQLVAPRRRPGTGLGHVRHDPARLRSMAMLETPANDAGFGTRLYARRSTIERMFGHWACTPALNPDLPAWIRGYPRVHRWVHAKIIAIMIDRLIRTNQLKRNAC